MDNRVAYRPAEAAEMLSISRSRIYELLATGELGSILIGRSRRIPREALERFVEARSDGQSTEAGNR